MRFVLSLGLMAIIMLAPLPLGSNRDWSWSPLALFVGLLLFIQVASATFSHSRLPPYFSSLAISALLFSSVVFWILFQTYVWIPSWHLADMPLVGSPASGSDVGRFMSAETEQNVTGLMRLLTYAGTFIIAAEVSADSRVVRLLFGTLVGSAVLYTLYSMIAGAVNQNILVTWSVYVPNNHQFTGPFINRNNYATYAALGSVTATMLALGVASRSVPMSRTESQSERWMRCLTAIGGIGGVWLSAGAILAVGVLLSGSRAGLLSLTLGLATGVTLLPRKPAARWRTSAGLAGALLLLVIVIPGSSGVLDRMLEVATTGLPGRSELFGVALRAISLRPLTGWGSNSFETVFILLQPATMNLDYDKAHNTYLELASDLGIPAALALVSAVGWIAIQTALGLKQRHRNRDLITVGISASVVVGVHALFDFSLQIPAVAIIYAVMLATSWAQSFEGSLRKSGPRPAPSGPLSSLADE